MFSALRRINQAVKIIDSTTQTTTFLKHDIPFLNQCRTTTILRRVKKLKHLKSYADPLKYVPHKRQNQLYEIERITDYEKEGNIEVVLKQYIQGLGNKGDVVSVGRSTAYNDLLMPGLAMYATEEDKQNARKKAETEVSTDNEYSSIFVTGAMDYLTRRTFSLVMNKDQKWVVEPWHIRVALRKAGVHVLDESCIQMPEKKIEGPDMNLEQKEFFVTITINNMEKVKTRMRIHHWSTELADRLPHDALHWTKRHEPLFASEKEELEALPVAPSPIDAEKEE